MILNYLKLSLRTLRKNSVYTLINTLGLVIGIAAALLLYRIVKYESGFNKSFAKYDRIVRVIHLNKSETGGQRYSVCTPIPAMAAMENTIHQFESMTRIKELWSTLVVPAISDEIPMKKFSVGDNEVSFFVENSFFKIFDLQWLSGDMNSALTDPGAIVLTKSWAEKCFDQWENAIGQTVWIDNLIPVKVEGVVNDLPDDCDFPLQFFVSYETLRSNADLFFHNEDSWGSCSSNDQVYALLQENADRDAVNSSLAMVGAEEYSDRNNGVQDRFHIIQALSDIHYDEDIGHSGTHHMSRARIKTLSMIGILILIIACFNFINLATAQASLRMKEVGVRKTLGGKRIQLIGQFITETGLLVLISVLLGVVAADLTLPWLAHVSHVPADLSFLGDPSLYGVMAILFLGLTLLAGFYPSMVISRFKPVTALQKNQKGIRYGGHRLRKSLIVLQFVIAQILILGAIIIVSQMEYIRNKDLGFRNDFVYTFSFGSDSTTIAKQTALKQGLEQIPEVLNVSFSSDQPLSENTWSTNFRFDDRPEDEPFSVSLKFCDKDYRDTYGLRLLAGEWYSRSDTMKDAVINETLLNKLGLSNAQEAVGRKIRLGGRREMTVTGVTTDFHTHSLRTAHQPLLMTTRKEYYWETGIKVRPERALATTRAVRDVFDRILPEQVFNGSFLDERIARYYEDDKRMSNTTKAFGLLAVLISCLGLYGLAAHAATQRIKEIGIRKVLGASISGIVGLLSYEFIKLVLFALVIASPLAFYIMDKWLQDFVYRIDISLWYFILTGLTTVALAFITVSYQSIKVAIANPVTALRSE